MKKKSIKLDKKLFLDKEIITNLTFGGAGLGEPIKLMTKDGKDPNCLPLDNTLDQCGLTGQMSICHPANCTGPQTAADMGCNLNTRVACNP